MKSARILLVEDHQDILAMFMVILSQKYIVSGHPSAEEALAQVESFRPDLLLLDVGMTPINGLECLAAIRMKSGFEAVPAIALTAYAREIEVEGFLAAGFQAVVTKPVLDQQKFETVIDRFLDRKATREPCWKTS